MGVQLITNGFAEQFQELIESTITEVKIISPFIGSKTAKKLAEWLIANPIIKCTVITRFYSECKQFAGIKGFIGCRSKFASP